MGGQSSSFSSNSTLNFFNYFMYQLLEGVEALPELLGNLTCLIGLTIRNYKKLMNLSSAKVMQHVATLLSQQIKQSSSLDHDITHESLRGIFSFMEPTLPQPSAVAGNAVEDINFYGLGNKNARGEVFLLRKLQHINFYFLLALCWSV